MADHIAAYGSYLEQEKHASANTVSSYLRDLNQFRSWLLENGAADLRRVKTDTINEYLRYLAVSYTHLQCWIASRPVPRCAVTLPSSCPM